MASKGIDSENTSKDTELVRGSEQEGTREKCQKDFKRNWRANNDYRRNRGSYHSGKILVLTV